MRLLAPLAIALVCLSLAGCKSEDDDLAPAFVPKTYTFEGQPDEQYAGTWKATNGVSTIQLDKDGGLSVETVTRSSAGEGKTGVKGKWAVSNGSLMLQYPEKSGETTVLKYTAKLKGNTLDLTQDGGKMTTTYKRN